MISNPLRTSRALLRALTVILLLNGCASRPVTHAETPDPCVVNDAAPDPTVRFAVRPADAADFVAMQLYDTLVRVDCSGAVMPGLAVRWSDSAGIVWRFELRRDAASGDGRPVTARDVLRSWTSERREVATSFAALAADGPDVLRVHLREPVRVQLFADHTLSVSSDDGGAIPAGTTAWRVDPLHPPRLVAAAGRSLAPVVFDDMKAALNEGVHGLVTADPDVLAYARTRSEYRSTPLPWTRTYVIATARSHPGARLPEEVLATFARDVVGGDDVRPAPPRVWWDSATCGAPGTPFANRAARDIVHRRGDRVARAIAERIAALAWPAASAPAWVRDLLPAGYGASGSPRVQALDDNALRTAIRTRLALAVVAPVPELFDRGCMGDAPESAVRALLSSGWQLTPVLHARDRLIHRSGLGRATVDGFGRIRIDP